MFDFNEERAVTACFTGHRPPKCSESDPLLRQAIGNAIDAALKDGFTVFMGGMALGAVMGSIPIGMCIGMAVGLCAGLCLDTRKFSEPDDGYQKEEPEEEIIEENEEAGKESDLSE